MALDSNFSYVTLLLNADGVDGSTSITDSSAYHKTANLYGGTHLTVTNSVSPPSSIVFNGTTDYLKFTTNSDFAFGTGDYTIELWFMASNVTSTQSLLDNRIGLTNTGVSLFIESGAVKVYTTGVFLSGGTLSTNAWTHTALTRNSGVTTLWVNGVSVSTSSTALTLSDGGCTIGRYNSSGSYYFGGNIDLLRISKGVCRYTATFDPSALAYDPAATAATVPIPLLSCYWGASASATFTLPTVYVGEVYVAAADVIAPTPIVFVGSGAAAQIALPSPTLSSTVHSSYGDNALIAAAPTATLSCYGGANAALTAPFAALSCTATGTALAEVTAQAPVATLAAAGRASEVLSLAATAPMVNLVGYGGVVCSVTTPVATVEVSGTGGATVGVAVTLPMFDVVASGTAQNHGSVIVEAPMACMATGLQAYVLAPMAQLVAVGTATVAATYEAYAMNMKHAPRTRGQDDGEPVNEVTRYTNFPFTHIVRHKNSYYGVNSSGLYLLEGTTDAGTAIPYEARTHISDLDEIKLKTVVSAYFGGRLGAASTVTLYAGESTVEAYAFTTPRGAVAQNYRQKFGRGLKTRYFALGASGSAEFSIDNVAFEVATMTRRV